MSVDYFTPALALAKIADTGVNGFALQNGTPTILSWTAPNDGQNHRVMIFGGVSVTVAQTGGVIQCQYTDPGNNAVNRQADAGGHAAGGFTFTPTCAIVKPGTTFSLVESTAMTLGTAVAFAELWAA